MKNETKRKSSYKWKDTDPYAVPKEKQAAMRKKADDEETDRKMQEAGRRHGMVPKEDKVEKYAKGGKVRGCGMAKRGVKKPRMY